MARRLESDIEFALDCAGKITDENIEAASGTYGGWKRLALIQARELATLKARESAEDAWRRAMCAAEDECDGRHEFVMRLPYIAPTAEEESEP